MDMPETSGLDASLRGYVYVLSNQAMPGLVKIGFSLKDPALRARELSGTGIPYPHILEYDVHVVDPRTVEQRTHQALASKRAAENREWFRCSVHEARAVIDALTSGQQLPGPRRPNAPGIRTESALVPQAKKTKPWEDAARMRPACAQWEFDARTLLLKHKSTGRTFQACDYNYDGDGAIKGFVVRNRETPWVRLEDVEFTN
jgi:hypothetical protein